MSIPVAVTVGVGIIMSRIAMDLDEMLPLTLCSRKVTAHVSI
jgi:hypothetical protein